MVHLLTSSVPNGQLVQLTLIVGLVGGPYVLLQEEGVESRRLIQVELVLGKAHRNRGLAHSRYKVSVMHILTHSYQSLTLA